MVSFRLLILTLRIRLTPAMRQFLAEQPQSCLILLWHNRLSFALATFARVGKGIPLTGLVSASADGAILAEIMHAFGIQTARGSSSRRAAPATRELLAALEAGRNVVITPDGPRGPVYTVKAAAAELGSAHARAIYVVGLNCDRTLRLNSWDRFMFPRPFARLEIDIEKINVADAPDAATLQAKLIALNR